MEILSRDDLAAVCNSLMEQHREGRARLFSEVRMVTGKRE